MAFDYREFHKAALEQIAGFGREAVFIRKTGSYDPVEGRMLQVAEGESAMAVITRPDEKALAGGIVLAGDLCLLVAGDALAKAPETGCLVSLGGTGYRIVEVGAVAPAGEAILYRVYCRRS